MENENKKSIKNKWLFYFLLFLGIVAFAVYTYNYYLNSRFCPPTTAAEFGDSFGAFGAIFSGLAFVAVLLTIQIQLEELKLTREELKLTRKEVEKSAKSQEKTSVALEKQLMVSRDVSKIQFLETFIDTDDTQGKRFSSSGEWRELSKKIIRTSVLNIFRLEEYDQFVIPEYSLNEISQSIKSHNNKLVLELKFETNCILCTDLYTTDIGSSSLKTFHSSIIVGHENYEIETKTRMHTKNNRFHITLVDFSVKSKLNISLHDTFAGHVWMIYVEFSRKEKDNPLSEFHVYSEAKLKTRANRE